MMQKDHIIFCSGGEQQYCQGSSHARHLENLLYYLGAEQILCVRADISCELCLRAG